MPSADWTAVKEEENLNARQQEASKIIPRDHQSQPLEAGAEAAIFSNADEAGLYAAGPSAAVLPGQQFASNAGFWSGTECTS